MMECPSCLSSLTRKKTPGGLVYICPRCKGLSAGMAVLRKLGTSQKLLSRVWGKSREKNVRRRRPCPHCAQAMAEVMTMVGGEELILDVCNRCPAIWFDTSEFKLVPRKPPPAPEKKSDLSPELREKKALLELEQQKKRQRQGDTVTYSPEESWHWLLGLLGLPVELDAPKVTRWPLVTWSTLAVCIIATMPIFWAGAIEQFEIFNKYGFIPAQWNRNHGLSLITSFFMHGGIFHLLGNMYFLFVFGDNVEDRMGHWTFVCLLLFSHFAGMLLHGTFGPDVNMPCVGASAGISGVIAYYAVAFPKVRLQILFGYFFIFRWIRITALMALVLYFLMQLIGAYYQINGFGSVSYLGHLGGLIVGLAFAFGNKVLQKRETAVFRTTTK